MFQFGISFWQKIVEWKYFDILRVDIYLLKYLQMGIHLLTFVRKEHENFEINLWQKEGHSKLASFSNVWLHPGLTSI